jgi:ABC-2 type transport system permease protein
MTRLFAVIERDLKKFRRNPVVLAMSILMPIIYLVILGNSFQGKLGASLMWTRRRPSAKRFMENLRAVEVGRRPSPLQQGPEEAVKGEKGIYARSLSL